MRGKILDFSISDSRGVISGEDGKRYSFLASEWMSNGTHPTQGLEVDFVADDDFATKIYPLGVKSNFTVQTETSAMAVTSLVFGIIGILFDMWTLLIPSLLAIILGHIARSKIKNSGGKLGGDGLALGGLILGYISLITYLIIFTFVVGALGFIISS